MEKKSYCSIDLFKFLAALLVVVIHTRPFMSNAGVDYYVTCFCRLAVPFFFIATSFFFFRKDNPDIKKYTKRLLLLYLIWFIIELPIVYNRFFVEYDKSLPLQIANLIRSLVFSNTWMASWFIMACILSVNVIYWLSRKLNNKWLLALGVAGYIVALACSGYSGAVDLLLNEKLHYYHAAFAFIFMPSNSFIVALIYVVLGKIVAERIQRNEFQCKQKNLIFLVLCFLLLGAEVYLIKWSVSINDTFVFLPLVAILGFTLLLQSGIYIPSKVSGYLRSMSILIYILHPVLAYLNLSFLGIEYGIVLLVITLIESLVLSFLIVALSNYLPVLKKLY